MRTGESSSPANERSIRSHARMKASASSSERKSWSWMSHGSLESAAGVYFSYSGLVMMFSKSAFSSYCGTAAVVLSRWHLASGRTSGARPAAPAQKPHVRLQSCDICGGPTDAPCHLTARRHAPSLCHGSHISWRSPHGWFCASASAAAASSSARRCDGVVGDGDDLCGARPGDGVGAGGVVSLSVDATKRPSSASETTAARAYVTVGDDEDDAAPGGLRKPLGLPMAC